MDRFLHSFHQMAFWKENRRRDFQRPKLTLRYSWHSNSVNVFYNNGQMLKIAQKNQMIFHLFLFHGSHIKNDSDPVAWIYCRPQRSCGKVIFLQASVILFTCEGHAWGCAWWMACMVGVCMAGGHVWWRTCMAGGVHGKGHVWWGVCMAGDMHGGGHAWRGHAWQGVCVAGGRCAWQEKRPLRYASYWNAFLLEFCSGFNGTLTQNQDYPLLNFQS